MSDPRSRQVAAELAEEIRTLPKGTRVPSEHQLMARFGVSRSTARSALQQLEHQYLVRRSQGAGTFVHRRLDYVISRNRRPSLHHQLDESGSRARTFVLSVRREQPPPEVRELLGGTGPLTRLERLAYLDDEVVTFLQEWFADDVVPHLEVGMNVIDSVEELLRGLRFSPVRSWCRVTVDVPPDRVCDRLELDHGSHAWSVDSLNLDQETGRPLFVSCNWTRIDLIRFVCEL
ncbi:GntR family transcriptional regulator [Enemella evansiae]|uniref:GntR family transcriptional regulator n=1 Tax=Enemella evansiae TaxID=2016499 RepID=UPI000B97A99E|nr:GntR family transcriptional regulator [Enemella evansiae]OYN96259.1 phosphonate metabolism protein PhnF [Enemella evansiae]OYO01775.1 phosphonate metabolism protein PhnF [Enemella evansiae]OYO06799.1 phosphonate metabolism protein PhnF [Enemella evansiae]OYO11048.1 phosphonate metabolism protein PhnF [Enemella evansiae]